MKLKTIHQEMRIEVGAERMWEILSQHYFLVEFPLIRNCVILYNEMV